LGLTQEQLDRSAALEQHQLRMQRMQRMSPGQLHVLLAGDQAEALEWVRSAAELGVAAAQVRLGRMLLEGLGQPRDARAAFLWFMRAAKRNDAEAMNMVGRCHELGWGVPINLSQAAVYYRSSADIGYDWGQYNFANLLFDGRGVIRDLRHAFIWFLRAAIQGHSRAMNLLARCLEEGWGCARSAEQAAEWFRRAAEAGYFRAQYNHALGLLRQRERKAAESWLWIAALNGDANIRRTITRLLRQLNAESLNGLASKVGRLNGMKDCNT